MPLLRKQPFHKQKPPPDLHPEEEVFHCKITNEIFRNYEAFFERIILCNSLVWSCAITGRAGMTYQEAVDCEERAKRHLATFQENLQRPLLFLATLTHRSRLADLNDDVFLFAKDRYFIGETVDISIGGERKIAHVIKVIPTTKSEARSNGDVIIIDEDSESDEASKRSLLDPNSLIYAVQPVGSKTAPISVRASQISRKRGLYTRDKSKLFLKQHCESVMGVWTVKEDKINKLGLKNAKFEDFCGGPKPTFAVSVVKRKSKKPTTDTDDASSFSVTPDKASQSQHSYAKTQEPANTVKHEHPALTSEERQAQREQLKQEKLAEKIAKREEMKRKLEEEKQKRKEEREKEREKKREERRLQIEQLKEWSRPREDMECDDLKPLPDFVEVKTRVPTAVFGDAVMVLEFVNAFKNVFDFKQFFPKGFSWAHLETALMEADPEGPLCDLLQMLLCAIFNLQEEEAEEYQELEREECHKEPSAPNTGEEEQVEEEISVSNSELIRSATVAAQFSQQTFGMPLRDTLLDQFTLTEVLRLHLLSSGARASSKNARFRYQQRGGYSSLDDPGIELRKQDPALVKKLQTGNVFDLSPGEKVRLLVALVQQVSTYAAVRDIMEENFEKLRLRKYDLKQMQWAEQRREREETAAKYRRLMEERLKEREKRLQQTAKAAEQLSMTTSPDSEKNLQNVVSSPGLESLVAEEREKLEAKERDEEAGKKAAFAQKELEMLQQIFELQHCNALYPLGRDRLFRRFWLIGSLPAVLVEDNELFAGNLCAPVEERGHSMPQLTRHDEGNTSSDKENDLNNVATKEAEKATTLPGAKAKEDCIVISDEEAEGCAGKTRTTDMDEPPQLDISQSLSQQAARWYLLDSRSCLDQLMVSLNLRGFRESSLHAALQDMRPLVNLIIDSCPKDQLCFGSKEMGERTTEQTAPRSSARKVQGQATTNEASRAMEVTLRDLLLDLDDRIFAGSLGALKVKDRTAWREALEKGHYNPQTDDPTFAQDVPEADNPVAVEPAARDLGRALVQIARGIEPRFLSAPLEDGAGEGNRSRVYERWEESSLAVSNLSQVFLHLATLDRSVKWDRSALLARCRICRRKGDADKMLLCDGCDRGHHMYCLKPPMTKVPPGDWFCSDCRPKEPRPSPRKNRRRTFSEVSDEESDHDALSLEETLQEASDEEEAVDYESNVDKDEEEEEDEEENEDVCAVCHNDGKLILCDVCPRSYHLHCAKPQLKKVPRGKWMCQVCVGGDRAGKIHFPKPQRLTKSMEKKDKKTPSTKSGKSNHLGSRRESPVPSPRDSPTPLHTSRGRKGDHVDKEVTPKVRGRDGKITLRHKSVAEKDITPKSRSQEKEAAMKLKRGSSSASRLSQESSDFETNIKQYTSSKRGNSQVQQMRTCEELLQELIRHEDAWPFLKPVDKRLVPDYYDVITRPMDLSTIRNGVHSFRYSTPGELLADVRLIFSNCVEYNARTTPEYRAGQSLAKFFQTRVRELGIHAESDATPPAAKKLRR